MEQNYQGPDITEKIVKITTIGLITIVLPTVAMIRGCESLKGVEEKVKDAPRPAKVSSSYEIPESHRLGRNYYIGQRR